MDISKTSFAQTPLFEGDAALLDELVRSHPELSGPAQSLYEDGFAIVDFGFDEALIETVRKFTFDNMKEKERIQDGWLVNASVKALATHPAVLSFLEALYGRAAIPFQTLNFKFGTQQRTHADTYHFNSAPARFMCGIWIALEDIMPGSGPVHYYAGSHKLPVYRKHELPGAQDYAVYEDFVAAKMEERGFERSKAMLKAGEALIWSANLFHGGNRRTKADVTRCSQVTHYFFEDCAFYTPLASDAQAENYFIREPYDIARSRFTKSNSEHLPGRPSLRHRLFRRYQIMMKRLP